MEDDTKRDSFIFYRSFSNAIKQLPAESGFRIYNAISDYVLDNIEPEFTGIELAIWSLIKPQLDANVRKYENGSKGGRPKKQTETNEKPKNNQEETKEEPEDNRTESDPKANANKNVNDNVNDNDNGKEQTRMTRSQFIRNKEQILGEAIILYPDKDCKKAIESFIDQTEIKDYKYKNYKRAYLKWVREDKFNEYKLNRTAKVPKWEPPKVDPVSKETIEASRMRVNELLRK